MKTLFDQTTMGGIPMKNRLVRSATGDGLVTPEGHLTEAIFDIYDGLAKGGTALIILGFTGVTSPDPFAERLMSLADNSYIPEYAELAARIHRHGARVMPQLALGTYQRRTASGDSVTIGVNDMTVEDITDIIEKFVAAASRAQQAGFDGVQLHGCHKVVLSEFLRPKRNHRRDRYGGSVQGRAQIVVDIIQGIHNALGTYHVSIKLNNTDMPKEDCLATCQLLEQAGLSSIEMEWLYPQLHEAMRRSIHIPIILTGEHRDPAEMERLMDSEGIDYFGLSRPLIRENDLPNRWQSGDRRPALCISCGRCLSKLGNGCAFRKKR